MKKRILSVVVLSIILASFSGCCLKHEWKEATCTEPKTCAKCEKTEGEALGHDWKKATCTEPETCAACGETKGEALGHIEGDWKIIEKATLISEGVRVKNCTGCGKEMASENYSMTPGVEGDHFNFTGEEFVDYVNEKFDSTDIVKTEIDMGDNTLAYIVNENGEAACYLGITIDKDGYAQAIITIHAENTNAMAMGMVMAACVKPGFRATSAALPLIQTGRYEDGEIVLTMEESVEYNFCYIMPKEY